MTFPKDFLWGVATASYQIEGAVSEDGRGETIWDRFSHTPGKVVNGDTGDVACDHYHRYPQDIALMRELGVKGYRFSMAWSRVLPTGTGTSNPKGLDFYDRLVDEILAAGITPFATLYHWDLPQVLQDRGGWTNPESVKWFAEYTDLITRHLGDRVKNWATHNEPFVIAFVGNYYGAHAPGIKDLPTSLHVAHHLLLSHGAAVPVIRQNVPDARVGIVPNLYAVDPASDSEADRLAAQYYDAFQNRWFLDPLFKGHYPADLVERLGDNLAGIDLASVSQAAVPIDFLGINYYSRNVLSWDESNPALPFRHKNPAGAPVTAMDWEVYPEGLYRTLVRVHQEYAPKAIYITENGAAYNDPTPTNGVVSDPERTEYLKQHFKAAENAIDQGVPLKGYFVWSFLDNFEWAEGYNKRFGIVYVDYATQQRTPKQSARFYQQMIGALETEPV